jgi:hypothetical protein
MRPPLPDDDPTIPAEFIELVRTCWHSDPTFRPSFLVRSFSPLATIRTAQAISLVSVGVCVCDLCAGADDPIECPGWRRRPVIVYEKLLVIWREHEQLCLVVSSIDSRHQLGQPLEPVLVF